MSAVYAAALSVQTIAFLVYLYYSGRAHAEERQRLINELFAEDTADLAWRTEITTSTTTEPEPAAIEKPRGPRPGMSPLGL